MDVKRSESVSSDALSVECHDLDKPMAEVIALREKVASLETRLPCREGKRLLIRRGQTEVGALMGNIKQNDPESATATRRDTRGYHRLREQPPTFAANDNSSECPWPLVPFPEGHLGISGALQELNRPCLFFEEVETPQVVQVGFRYSWSWLAYVAVVSIAMFGWLYLLWLGLVSSVQAILS